MKIAVFASLAVILLTGCQNVCSVAWRDGLPPLAETVRGEHNFGDHVMIYGDHTNRFIWGIVFPRDTMTLIDTEDEPVPHTAIELESGIRLVFIKDEVTISKGAQSAVIQLKPYTIYLMNERLATSSSTNLSGVHLSPKTIYSRYTRRDEINYELVLPDDLYTRFGKTSF